MSRGELGGKGTNAMRTQAGLSAQDCLFLGKHCFNSGALSRSIEWFEEAWVMAGRCETALKGLNEVASVWNVFFMQRTPKVDKPFMLFDK